MEKLTVQDLAMYLGCEVGIFTNSTEVPEKIDRIETISVHDECICFVESPDYYMDGDDNEFEIKPILRPLSDMTEEERSFVGTYNYGIENFASDGYGGDSWMNIIEVSNKVKYLCSKGIDVFGWIGKGLALDKTKL